MKPPVSVHDHGNCGVCDDQEAEISVQRDREVILIEALKKIANTGYHWATWPLREIAVKAREDGQESK